MKGIFIFASLVSMSVLIFSFGFQSDLESSKKRGKNVYSRSCVACHMAAGEGISGVFPPLAKSDYLMDDLDRSILGLIKGQSGEMKVNGTKYNGAMPASGLNDQDIVDVLNYIRNSWGNEGDVVQKSQVTKVRAKS